MIFLLKAFKELSTEELFAIYKLRAEVFVVEQNCAYQDVDDKDLVAKHLMLREGPLLMAYCRLLPPGTAYPSAAIGRVVVSKLFRGKGFGKLIMKEALALAKREFGANLVIISAQVYLSRFYQDLGFEKTGEEYLEDNIPHQEMIYKC